MQEPADFINMTHKSSKKSEAQISAFLGRPPTNLGRCGTSSGVRNRRSVWTLARTPYGGAHYATMPTTLAELCIQTTCPVGGLVLDPFGGAGTTGLVANQLDRNAILCELNPEYAELGKSRILQKCSDSKVCVLDPLDMPF